MNKFLFIIPILILISCGHKNKSESTSTTILNKKKMATVLMDVYLAEGNLMSNMQAGINTKVLTNHYYNYIFTKHNITRDQYLKSMHYYSFHLNEMKEVYNDVINRLTALHPKPVNREE